MGWWVAGAFSSATAIRVWMIRSRSTNPMVGFVGIFFSYCPSFLVYHRHQDNYSAFLADISMRYRDRIRDDQLAQFKQNQK